MADEKIPLTPQPLPRQRPLDPGNAAAADVALDALVPRGGTAPPGTFVSLEELLSRLASLGRKLRGMRYRLKQWTEALARTRDSFDRLLPSTRLDSLPVGASAEVAIQLFDVRLESEFESLLFSIRSMLDVLSRVVAAHLEGATDIHSYRGLQKYLRRYPSHPAGRLMTEAMSEWGADLFARRDAGTHYLALALVLRRTLSRTPDGVVDEKVVFLGIPERPNASLPIWYDLVPILGDAPETAVQVPEGEAHGIFDGDGTLIVRHNGALPVRPPTISGEEYVERLHIQVEAHIAALLGCLNK
jgi:hypothetical protein